MPAPSGNCTIRALQHMESQPEKCALWSPVFGFKSFRELGQMAASYQGLISASGIAAGDVVLVMALPGPELYACLLALMGLGVGVVFIEPWMPSKHIEQSLAAANVKMLFADHFGFLWSLRSAPLWALRKVSLSSVRASRKDLLHFRVNSLERDLPAIISFTTGTTGLPKGVIRTHNYLWELHSILEKYGGDEPSMGPDLTIFPNLVLYHLGTGRGSLLVPPDWRPSIFQKIRELSKEYWPQSLSCGPAFLKHLLDHNAAFESLRSIHVGGALVECDLLERALLAIPHVSLRQVYGGTEVEPIAVVDAEVSIERSRSKGFLHALHLGDAIDELSLRIDEQSVLWVSGPNVCPEYLGNSAESAMMKVRDENGTLWHCTGDRVLKDDDGLWFMGRSRQTLSDFIAEQKIYAKIGHTRAFIHRDENDVPIVVADDDAHDVSKSVHEVMNRRVTVWASVMSRDRRHRSRIDRLATWEKGLRMLRWWTYIKERSPLPVLVGLALGPIVSGYYLLPHELKCLKSTEHACPSGTVSMGLALFALISFVLFMVIARMMDEIKDYEKDKLANPSRPLPRGLISLREMNFALRILMIIIAFFAFYLGMKTSVLQGALFGFSLIYLWFMYKEFYVGKRLADFPFLYALTHQIVMIPLYLFFVSLFSFEFLYHPLAWIFVAINLFSSLSFEFARKLKPDAHAAARTYRQHYGLRSASSIAFFFQLLSMAFTIYSSLRWNTSSALLGLQIAACLAIVMHCWRDRLDKYCESLAALSLLGAAWFGLISRISF